MAIRRARAGDSEACAEVHESARAAMSYLPQDLHTAEETRAWMRDVVFRDQTVWVAEVEGRIVGYASAGDGTVSNLYVLPGFQRQGLGSALLSQAKAHSPAGLKLWTFEPNVDAIRFYERHGFLTLEHTDGRANEERVPDRLMAWQPPD